MSKNICKNCNAVFKKKIELANHLIECNIDESTKVTNEQPNNLKLKLKHILKSCLNILRDCEGITGEKALYNLTYLLVLKLIEPKIGNEIDIDNYHYSYYNVMKLDQIEQIKPFVLKWSKFSNIIKEHDDNIDNAFKKLCKFVLSDHITTKCIFRKQESFDIKKSNTFKRLCNKLQEINLSDYENDVLGDVYEDIMSEMMTGKVLGQFFTPIELKQIMIDLIEPKLIKDNYESICDPAMGTGGFLIKYIESLIKQSKDNDIPINWNELNSKIYGKEIEPTTYSLAVANLLISSGHIFNNIQNGDSIRVPIREKFDIVMANPPFGIKGLKYNEIEGFDKNTYIPIKSDNAICLFLQAIINMLNINGRCAIVLPNGQEIFSKTNQTFIDIRTYLMKTCDLKEIIHMPSNMFEFTSIKTCIFFFVKKKEGNDVLTIHPIKKSKKLENIFIDTHETSSVLFYEYNIENKNKDILIEVPIHKIASNSYSLNYAEYMKEETEQEQYEESIEFKTLGELCTFLPKSKRNAKYGNSHGLYPFFKSSIKVDTYIDEPDYNEESLIIGDGGEPNINYGVQFSTSDHCYILQNKNNKLLNLKYTYYYIFHNLDMMKQLYTGVAIKNISKTNIENIKIPIPSLERQQEVVKYLDFNQKKNKTCLEMISELKLTNQYCLEHQQIHAKNEIKTLGEVCEFIKTGKNKPSDNKTGTLYPYYGTGSITGYTDEYLFDGKYILTARNGTIGNCVLTDGRFFPSDHMFIISIKDINLMKYIYYILSDNKELDKLKTGVGIPNITKGTLETFKIYIPSTEKLKYIVDSCEKNDAEIKQLEKNIEENKKDSQQFINMIVTSNNETNIHESDIHSIFDEE